jgi:HK97 family phage portal protein
MLERLLARTEERALSFQTIWGAGDTYALSTKAGTVVTQETAMRIGTVYACVRLISDSISTLPVGPYRRFQGERLPVFPRPMWLDFPELDVTRVDHFQQVLVSLLVDGNAFVRVVRDDEGIVGLIVLNPYHVTIHRDGLGRIYYRVHDETLTPDEMLHIVDLRKPGQLRGESRIDLLKEQLGLAAALEEFAARFFGNGSTTQGIIEFPGALTKEQAKNLVDGFEQSHKGLRRAHRPGVLSSGAKFVKTGVNPNEAQMLESRQMSVEEIARIFRCPPSMLGVTTPGAMSYASVEANQIHFVTHTLRPYIVKLEDAYSKLLPEGQFIKFNVDGLLRGDSQTRSNIYSQGIQAGWLSINDIHRLEDMTAVEGGDVYRVPLANVDLSAANLVETDKRVQMAQRLVQSGFEPAAVLQAMGLPPITHTGVPSTQLQAIAQIDPTNPEAVYEVG